MDFNVYKTPTVSVPFPVLLFDLGGVLIQNKGFEILSEWLPNTLDRNSLKDRWLSSLAVRRFEIGKSSAPEFANQFIAEWEIDMLPSTFLTEFLSWPVGFYDGALKLISTLRKRYTVGCLSNSNSLHWEKFGGFRNEFDVTLSSHLLGVVKPDREAFRLAALKCQTDPNNIYYFDDSLANVCAAEQAGMRSFHSDGFDLLQSLLRQEGIA